MQSWIGVPSVHVLIDDEGSAPQQKRARVGEAGEATSRSVARPLPGASVDDDTDVDEDVGYDSDSRKGQPRRGREAEAEERTTCGLYGAAVGTCCKFDGKCFQRGAAHFAQFAHPKELAKPYCPRLLRGEQCKNIGDHQHNATFSHGPLPSEMRAYRASQPASAAGASQPTSTPTTSAPAALIAPPMPTGAGGILRSKFVVPPFSAFDAKQGPWQARKKLWHEVFDSSEGRSNSERVEHKPRPAGARLSHTRCPHLARQRCSPTAGPTGSACCRKPMGPSLARASLTPCSWSCASGGSARARRSYAQLGAR